MPYGARMVEQSLRTLAHVERDVLGDPAAADEFILEMLQAAGTLSDLEPLDAELDNATYLPT